MRLEPRPFTYRAPESELRDLRRRVRATRFGPELGTGWEYGMRRDYLRDLLAYWASDFDWRDQERRIAAVPNFVVDIGGRPVHFVHVRSGRPGALPLLITHGWPSSFLEFLDIAPLLAEARPDDGPDLAFDIVIPSMPGYGFSAPPAADGRTSLPIADLWVTLMRDVLGYERFIAQGGDIGAGVSISIARNHPAALLGLHLTTDWADPAFARPAQDPEDRAYLRAERAWDREEGAYGEIQGTKPHTLAAGLDDSPAGLLAWIVEKWRAWSDRGDGSDGPFTPEQLLSTVTLYWLTRSIGASFLPYYRYRHVARRRTRAARIEVPTGIARMPGDEPGSPGRGWASRQFDLVHWTEMPRGGHFAALEVPHLLAADLRSFAAGLAAGRAAA
jgi:pimeloyl-ACP methyl ester carboxylesterase